MARTTDKEAKRKQIIDGALKVFARKGLSNFKMADIAIEAKVGKGTLYEYFRTKEALIIGSVDDFMGEFEAHVMEQVAAVEKPADKIRRLMEASLEFCLKNEDNLDAMLDFYAVGVPRKGGEVSLMDLGPRYRNVIKWLASVIDDGIEQGVFRQTNSEAVASLFVGILDGLIFQAAVGATTIRPKEISDQFCDTFLNGILKGNETGNE